MRNKRSGKKWMVLKLDLEKALDRIRWDFLEDSRHAAGFPINWISECVSSVNTRVLWNGEVSTGFKPKRGLRQGDPLSPYLFLICIERLSHLILRAVNVGEWKPIRLSRNGPPLSHIFFADDILLLSEASVGQLHTMMGCLDAFCKASGQKISIEKSKIYVSRNVNRGLRERLHEISGFVVTDDLGTYLGVPLFRKTCLLLS